MATESSFNATGAEIGQTHFESVGGSAEVAVSVLGSKCGVHGEGGLLQDSAAHSTERRNRAPDGTGVHGAGDKFGVKGEGPVGVAGTGINGIGLKGVYERVVPPLVPPLVGPHAGVMGEAHDREAIGVLGQSNLGVGVHGTSQESIGVHGTSEEIRLGTGVGVKGEATGIDRGPVGGPNRPTAGDLDFPNGTGVWGTSINGIGVRGASEKGYAGWFETGPDQRAEGGPQVRLKPKVVGWTYDGKFGRPGDLIAVHHPGGNSRFQAELWFCVQGEADVPPSSAGGNTLWIKIAGPPEPLPGPPGKQSQSLGLPIGTYPLGELYVDGGGTGTVVSLKNLPTSDPAVAGQLWNKLGVVTVSAG